MGWLPREEDGSATVEVGARPATGDREVEAVLGYVGQTATAG